MQTRSQNITRRRAALSCVRSCLFDKELHWWMLYEAKIMTPLLYPLVAPISFTAKERDNMDPLLWMSAENTTKKVEPNKALMHMMLDCILLLCARRGIREELRRRKVYAIIKNLDTVVGEWGGDGEGGEGGEEQKEQNELLESIQEGIFNVVDYLQGDEDPETRVDTYEEYKAAKTQQQHQQQQQQAQKPAFAASTTASSAVVAAANIEVEATGEGEGEDLDDVD